MGTVAAAAGAQAGVVGGLVIAAATSSPSSLRRESSLGSPSASSASSSSSCSWKMSSVVSGARMVSVDGNGHANGDSMVRTNGSIRAVASEPRAKKVTAVGSEQGDSIFTPTPYLESH